MIKLNLNKYTAWRNIITPVDVTFRQLHNQLQTVFGWKDYHLYCFNILDKTGRCAAVIISKDEEIYDSYRDCELLIDTDTKLSEYLNEQYKIVYCYDYGDAWDHEITIGSIQTDYDKNYPVCVMGEGNTPPEDIGGVSGYMEFLNIISDPDHKEYKHMYEWARSQGYKEFDIELVNRILKGILKRY